MDVSVTISVVLYLVVSVIFSCYLIVMCDGEENINCRKLGLIIFMLGPGGWLGASVTYGFLGLIKYADSVVDWFRRKNGK